MKSQSESFEQQLEQHLQHRPQDVAYAFLANSGEIESSLTFAQLDLEARKIAAALRSRVAEGDRVLIVLPTGRQFMSTLFGCFQAGVVAVPLLPPQPNQTTQGRDLISKIGRLAGARVLLTDRDLKARLEPLLPSQDGGGLSCLDVDNCLDGEPTDSHAPSTSGNRLALVLYTSGSTGDPKGVMIRHDSFISNIRAFSAATRRSADDVVCTWLPNAHVAGLFTRLLGAVLGSKTIIFPAQFFLESPVFWLRAISDHKATFSAAPNFAYDICCQHVQGKSLEQLDLSSWSMAVTGGEVVRRETFQEFTRQFSKSGLPQGAFCPYYGLTETLCTTVSRDGVEPTILRISQQALSRDRVAPSGGGVDEISFVSNGAPLAGTQVMIVDPNTLSPCEPDQIGEIWTRGQSNTAGYLGHPDLTRQTCQAALPGDRQGHFFRTGDLGFLRGGELYVTGRLKEVVILQGKNYYPHDIEDTVNRLQIAGISGCAAFSIVSEGKEGLALAIERAPDGDTAAKIVQRIARALAARHGIDVAKWVLLTDQKLPRTSTRKIRRNTCRQNLDDGTWTAVNPLGSPQSATPQCDTRPSTEALSTEALSTEALSTEALSTEALLAIPPADRTQRVVSLLRQTLSDVLGCPADQIDITCPLPDLGISSINAVSWIMAIDNKLQAKVPMSVFYDKTTLTELARRILSGVLAEEPVNTTVIEFASEVEACLRVLPAVLPAAAKATAPILFTGATGFVGAYLVNQMLETQVADVYCLVRAPNHEEARERLLAALSANRFWRPSFAERVIAVVGDLSNREFGLEPGEFDALAGRVGRIFHCAANVNFVAPYAVLERVNVESAREVVRLACQNTLKPIHFVSTMAVFNSSERVRFSPIRNTDRVQRPETIYSGYAQSKWVAETLLAAVAQRGVPVTIYRPGIVTGDSQTGFANVDDFLCRFIKGCVQLKAFPAVKMEIDISPVDYVSRAIALFSARGDSHGKIHNIFNVQPITISALAAFYQSAGYCVETIPLAGWHQRVNETLAEDNALYPVWPFLQETVAGADHKILEFFDGKQLDYDYDSMRAELATSDISCPPADAGLLDLYHTFFVKTRFMKGPQHAAVRRDYVVAR